MSHLVRIWWVVLLLGGLILLAPSLVPPAAPPARAQAATATPVPATATPMPEPTLTIPQALDRIASGEKPVETLFTLLGQRPLLLFLGLLLLALVVWLGLKLIEGFGEGVKERGTKIAERRLVVPRVWRESPEIRKYLSWLRTEYGSLPQIGVATEQVKLDVEAVHVPLRVVERAEAEAHQRQMRGESEEDETMLRPRRSRRLQRPFSLLDFDEDADKHIFTLLSDPAEIKRRLRRAAQMQSLSNMASSVTRRFQRSPARFARRRSVPTPRQSELGQPSTSMCLLLLGGAGSGKTMTLRYAALRCADAYLRGRGRSLGADLGLIVRRPPLPIYARLTLFANTLPQNLEELSPQDRERYQGSPPELFLNWLDSAARCSPGVLSGQVRRGGCLLLLDGLDESGSEAHRAYLAELITNITEQYPGNRYVVASRTAGYGGRVHLSTFIERHLSPLDADEVQSLISKWFRAVYARLDATGQKRQAEGADDQISHLQGVIERNPRLFEMATNPLLATTMALLQFNNIKLPDQRARLYEKLVELLLDLWRKTTVGNDTLATTVAQLSTEQRRIQRLALHMQMQPTQAREVTLAQAQAWLSPIYEQRLKIDREDADARVANLLESLSIDSGLLQRTQRTERVYSFSHYTFQEYLAARGLDALDGRTGKQDSVGFLLARSDDQRWRETLLLAAGQWSNSEQLPKTDRLLAGLLARKTQAADLLAGQALADIGAVEELTQLHDEIATRLRALAFHPDVCPDPVLRNRAATLLDRLGADERPELDPEHPDYWATRIEPGPFSMGADLEAFTARIQQPFALARFPVTNRLYARYLDDLLQRGKQKESEQRRPHTWPGRSYRPGEGNHPVTGVNWHNAMAFAAWLDADLRQRGVLAAGEQVRLPLETEWERAAAYPVTIPHPTAAATPLSRSGSPVGGEGTERRAYPWGDWPGKPVSDADRNAALLAGLLVAEDQEDEDEEQALPGPANTSESGIGGTSAVGMFPDGQAGCGAQDMAGNVWEWCATAYQDYPLPDSLAPETLDTEAAIVLRGGSWNDDRRFARCAYRYLGTPINNNLDLGFRLARVFSS